MAALLRRPSFRCLVCGRSVPTEMWMVHTDAHSVQIRAGTLTLNDSGQWVSDL